MSVVAMNTQYPTRRDYVSQSWLDLTMAELRKNRAHKEAVQKYLDLKTPTPYAGKWRGEGHLAKLARLPNGATGYCR